MSNYINDLQNKVILHEATIREANKELSEVMAYLQSEKFHNDTTVQVKDVLSRLLPIRGMLLLD